jgi:hypothetical protein
MRQRIFFSRAQSVTHWPFSYTSYCFSKGEHTMSYHSDRQYLAYPEHLVPTRRWTQSLLILSAFLALLLSACGGSATPPQPTPQATASALFSDNSQVLLTVPESDRVQSHLLPANLPKDLTVTVNFTLQKASADDSAGILLRTSITSGSNPQTIAYWVEIYGNNTLDIWKNYVDPTDSTKVRGTALTGPSHFSAMRPQGQSNKMTVIIKGASIVLFINDQFVATVTDIESSTALTTGDTRLFVYTGKSGIATVASFQSVAVYPAPDTLPTH